MNTAKTKVTVKPHTLLPRRAPDRLRWEVLEQLLIKGYVDTDDCPQMDAGLNEVRTCLTNKHRLETFINEHLLSSAINNGYFSRSRLFSNLCPVVTVDSLDFFELQRMDKSAVKMELSSMYGLYGAKNKNEIVRIQE